jgi:hypothetical protein
MYRKWYPPGRYVFYPLYRCLRRKGRLPCALAYFLVWLASAILHGTLLLVLSDPAAGAVIAGVLLGLGLIGAGVVLAKQRRRLTARGRRRLA